MSTEPHPTTLTDYQEHAQAHHAPVRDRPEAIGLLDRRLQLARDAHNMGPADDVGLRFAHRLMQIAAIATRAVADLGFDPGPPEQE